MDLLRHDPLTKQQIQQRLQALLYTPVEINFQARLNTLIMRNTLLGGYRHKSFVYKGHVYSSDVEPPPLRQNRLIPQLKADMEEYLRDLESLNKEELPYVMGYITNVLNSSNSIADYLQLFPEAVHQPIRELAKSCPCQQKSLSDTAIAEILQKNAKGIDLMKQRMTLNLLS